MTDIINDSIRTTTEIMTELTAKAQESLSVPNGRRKFFERSAAIAGLSALGAAGSSLLPKIAMASTTRATTKAMNNDTLKGIIDLAATAESLAVTFYYNALQNPTGLPDVNSSANQNYFQAALTQEFEHLNALKSLGAEPVTTQFYFPSGMFTDESVFFPTAILLEEYFISAYLAAALDFSGAVSSGITTAIPYALGFAVQVMGVECEHKALLGVAANHNPPNFRVFEKALLKSVNAAAGPLEPFLTGGSGFTGLRQMPNHHEVNKIAAPYGFSFFGKEVIV